MENHQYFNRVINAIFALDCLLTGQNMPMKLSIKHVQKVAVLMENAIDPKGMKFNNYLYETFQSYIKSKTSIIIDLAWLDHESTSKQIAKIIMNTVEEGDVYRVAGDMTNLFKVEMLKIFTNVKIIRMVLCDEDDIYVVSLESLLGVIKFFQLDKIILVVGEYYYAEDEDLYWKECVDRIKQLYPITTELEKRYDEQNYRIKIKHKTGTENQQSWCIIEKK